MIGVLAVDAVARAGAGCPGLQAINPVCQVGTVLGSVGGTVASAGIDAVLNGVSQWVASGAEWLLGQIGDVLNSTTSIDLGAGWFRHNYTLMTGLAGVVVLPLLLVSTLQAIFRQHVGQLLRSFLLQLPLALLLGVISIQIVVLSLSATDAMCSYIAGGSSSSVASLLSTLSAGLVSAGGDPGLATFVLLLVGLLVAGAAFVLWLELLVRAAAVYVAALFLPMALVTLVWPSVSHWCRRLVETLAALILSKFVIVATLSLAAGAVSSGVTGTNGGGSNFAAVLAGGALLVLATFVPFAILRLIPMVEAGAVAHLEGARQRGTAAVTRIPRSAASFALGQGFEAIGASRLLAAAGPVGTGGAGAGALAAMGSAGGGGGGGSSNNRSSAGGDGAGSPESDDHGGLVITPEGSLEEIVASMSRPRPGGRGPMPVTRPPTPASAASEDDDELPPDFHGWIDPPRPGHNRHYWGRDHAGPVLRYVPPKEKRSNGPRPDGESTE